MMSSREWEAELKCSATGNPRDLFRILRSLEKKSMLTVYIYALGKLRKSCKTMTLADLHSVNDIWCSTHEHSCKIVVLIY